MRYGDRLKKLRESKKLSQQQLAEKLNINRSTYARYELNQTQPDYETLQRLADFYDVSTDYILTGINTKLTEKDERDVAKRMEKIKQDLAADGGLSFYGEPLSEEAKESLLEAMEYAVRTAQRINKKYIPKKYREEGDN
ncbi:helix-turn-helix domain-containing protein [Caldibacillus thermolactis]|jgi:transcriptional regulator with XRE-family HTH domain|uniref:Helix-turn-helix domain-containing protein n=1 Tax=Pallidibacillus thermolactis TaxID=251051 RepID=A0ABT2WGJ2_9BACI|nr:helix-turn-helix transcriptional regulator [Pallidibacillus thermolactis]MCU9594596.1 helix-turn-helix domain-containing protein [Pallidibacillus thermolactis]